MKIGVARWRTGMLAVGIVGLLSACFAVQALGQGVRVEKVSTMPALTPLAVHVGGRVLASADDYRFQWPGTYFDAALDGDELYFRVGSGPVHVRVVVDGKSPLTATKLEAGLYRVAGMGKGKHAVRVLVVNESQSGADSLGGFGIVAGEKALAAGKVSRQIEFIGDSHTVGYGNTSAKGQCSEDEVWATTDDSQAFGALTAGHYGADYQVNAISGRGVVRNYNGSGGDTLPVAYPYVLFDKQKVYADAAWRPQVIVMALGTNDFSTALNPGEKWKTREELHADFEATYVRFIERVRSRNKQAAIVLWATDLMNGEIEAEAQKVVQRATAAGVKKIGFVPMDHLLFTGCNGHPSLEDHRTISKRLVEWIDAQPGVWQ